MTLSPVEDEAESMSDERDVIRPPIETGGNSRSPVLGLIIKSRLLCEPIAVTEPGISDGAASVVEAMLAIHLDSPLADAEAAGVAEISSANVEPFEIGCEE